MSIVPQLDNLILASGSPRRKEMFESLGLTFRVMVSACDETILPNEQPKELVERLALLKAQAVATIQPQAWVVGADTVVVIDNQILGKPEDEADACRMLQQIQGREHVVFGGIAIVRSEDAYSYVESHKTVVKMRELSDDQIKAYVATREPLDKAGSYAIQGVGASLVESVSGSYTNVVGLNLSALVKKLASLKK